MTGLGRFDELPRCEMTSAPTALAPMARLTQSLGGAKLWVKRDDTHPIAFGGNKVRQLEYYFGQAQAAGADTVLITGAVQSNFCRLTAGFAAALGMSCHVQQEERVAKSDSIYRTSGNVLIERLLGARLHSFPTGEDESGADANLEAIAEDLRGEGRRPYVIHLAPGHPPWGALGYVACARELLVQLEEQKVDIDHIVVPSGSGATHAGLLFGLRALGSAIPVTGICVRRPAEAQTPRLIRRCAEIAEVLAVANPVREADVIVDDRFLAPGYGLLNRETEIAIRDGARCEALILDPVYSGKCMAGALDMAREFGNRKSILFLHTGGLPTVFAYAHALEPILGG